MATQHFGFAARTPSWISDASRLPISTIPASIIALACVNIVTLLVVVGLKYRHLLFRHSYPSKVSLSPAVSHLEPLPEKHNEPSSIPPTSQLPELDIASPFPDLARPEATQAQREQMAKDKQLYHELQNLEDHPGAADRARKRLVELLDRTVHEAKATPSSGIISIDRYTPSALRQFFQSGHTANSLKYEAYIQRRRAGGPREIFPTYEYAVQWLKLAACVKYVDGSWVSNVLNMGIEPVDVGTSAGAQGGNKMSAHAEREAAKLAWQVITEEFGDGDIEKNHVHLYYELIRSLDPTAQPGNVSGFDGLAATEGAHRCWTAAIAQQCVGLMAGTDDFSPEALGFNMAYETLPYHLLVTSCELRELEIDDYYFALHITIDNPDSGHAALARVAVETFLEGIRERDGAEAMHAMWRRVQAGVILADGLPTTPAGPVEHERCPVNGLWRPKTLSTNQVDTPPASAIEAEMTRLLTRKSLAAEKMHCSSRIRIEGLTVEKWLDPASWNNTKALDFLRALGRKRPWVVPGDKANSRLVRELEWGGRMFGAFSAKETDLVRRWIGQLGQGEGKEVEREVGAYARFVGPLAGSATSERDDDDAGKGRYARYASKQLLTVSEEEVSQVIARLPASPSTDSSSSMADMHARAVAAPLSTNPAELATLWFTLPALLEHFPLSPSKLASPLGMCTLRVLRSFSGFPDLHAPETICAGMDHVVGPTHLSSDMTDTSEEGVEDTRGWAEIGYELFDITPGLERDHASSKAVGSEMEGMSADMLALRSRPYAHADILLGMTYAGVHRIMADASFLQQVVEADKAILERIQAEVRVAIEEYMASPAGRDVVGMEGFLRGYERVMTAAI